MQLIGAHDDRVAYDDGFLYVIYFKEEQGQGKWKNRLVIRHAMSMDEAQGNFEAEMRSDNIDYSIYRIMRCAEMRRFLYE